MGFTIKENYNTKITAEVSHSELAKYSVDNCRFCEFKGACNTFWKENPQPIPGTDDYGCLSGRVLRLAGGATNRYSIVIAPEKTDGSSQEWEVSNLSTKQFGNLEELVKGTFVRLINFKIDSDGAYRAKPTETSIIWSVPSYFLTSLQIFCRKFGLKCYTHVAPLGLKGVVYRIFYTHVAPRGLAAGQ